MTYLKDGCPIPSIFVLWKQHRRQDTEKWDERYFGRMIVFNELSWVVGYEVIWNDDLHLVENLDHEEKIAADKKVGVEVKMKSLILMILAWILGLISWNVYH